jgi:hypothetical protein
MLTGIGALVFAVLMLLALYAWRRRKHLVNFPPEQEFQEAATEFGWDAQIVAAFTGCMTYENPERSETWENAHFSQLLTARDEDDPFTQFE